MMSLPPSLYLYNKPLLPVAQNLPAMQQMQVRPLGGEDPLDEDMATHSSIPAWSIP